MQLNLLILFLGIFIGWDFSVRNLIPTIEVPVFINVPIYEYSRVKVMTVSAYSLRKKECDSDLKNTALMRKPIVGRTAAVSRDNLHLLGKEIYVEGKGIWVVTDVMHERWTNRIDLLMTTKKAKKFTPIKLTIAIIG